MKTIADSMTEMEEIILKIKRERMRYLMALRTISNLVELGDINSVKEVLDFALDKKEE